MLIGGTVENGTVDEKTNTIMIKIPQMFGDKSIPASVCHIGGVQFTYPQGAAVVVGFFNHDASRPVVLGPIDGSILNGLVQINAGEILYVNNSGEQKSVSTEIETAYKKAEEASSDLSTYLSGNASNQNNSNSSLATYTMITSNRTSPRNHKIDTITIHSMQGNETTAKRIAGHFNNPERQASPNYGVAYDGKIALICEEKDRSWCSSSRANDNRSITIVVSTTSQSRNPQYLIYKKAYVSMLNLMFDICVRNNFSSVGYLKAPSPNDKLYRKNYSSREEQDAAVNSFIDQKIDVNNHALPSTACALTLHRWFDDTDCPGNSLFSKMNDIVSIVNYLLSKYNHIQNEEQCYIEDFDELTSMKQNISELSDINLTDGFTQ